MKKKRVVRIVIFWLILKVIAHALRHIAIRKIKQINKESFPEKGPLLVLFHHLTVIEEAGILFQLLWKKIHFVYKDEIEKTPWGLLIVRPFLRFSGMIPAKRGKTGTAKEAEEKILFVLEQGGRVAAAPERSSRHFGLVRAKARGLFRIAIKQNCPILPVAVHNATGALVDGLLYYLKWTPLWFFFRKKRRSDIYVVYGIPIKMSELGIDLRNDPPGLEGQAAADAIMIRIGAMLPRHLRGEYTEDIDAFLEGTDPDVTFYRDIIQPLVNHYG